MREFMKSADAVSSNSVVSDYDVRVSPATVRHEMVELSDMGYLYKAHSSSGRYPTNLGIRFFVREIMEEDPVPASEEAELKMELLRNKFEEEKIIRRALDILSTQTGSTAVSLLNDVLRFKGVSSLTGYKELRDIEVLENVMTLLENDRLLRKVFEKGVSKDVCLIMGEESDVKGLRSCAIVFAPFKYLNDKAGYVGVIGPRRMRYSKVIPLLRFVRDTIQQSVRGW